jgi:hypothetical protein
MFRDPVMVEGYPVKRRAVRHVGLEVPWHMMLALGEVRTATQEDGYMLLVGVKNILVPIDEDATSCVWHLLADPDGQVTYDQAVRHAMPAYRGSLSINGCESCPQNATLLGGHQRQSHSLVSLVTRKRVVRCGV